MVQRKAPSREVVRGSVAAVAEWLDEQSAAPARPLIADAVRASARSFAAEHPGGSVELRVPPFVAVQCVPGADHRRGTPPNVVEMRPRTWLRLATGRANWAEAIAAGEVSASGARADLTELLPMGWLTDV